MLDTILVNPLEQSTQKIVDLLNQLTQDYQQLLQQDQTLLLEIFPPNSQNLSILEEIDLLTTDLRGYASQISINQQIQNPDQALTSLCVFLRIHPLPNFISQKINNFQSFINTYKN